MKAVKRFKDLLFKKRPMEGMFGRSSRFVAPPEDFRPATEHRKAHSTERHDRKPTERFLATEGVHHELDVSDKIVVSPRHTETMNPADTQHTPEATQSSRKQRSTHSPKIGATHTVTHTASQSEHLKGQAHDPLTDFLFLDVGANSEHPSEEPGADHMLSESPGAVDINVYETAYEEEMKKILERRGREPTIYLTRRVEGNKAIREHQSVINHPSMGGLAGLVQRAKEAEEKKRESED